MRDGISSDTGSASAAKLNPSNALPAGPAALFSLAP